MTISVKNEIHFRKNGIQTKKFRNHVDHLKYLVYMNIRYEFFYKRNLRFNDKLINLFICAMDQLNEKEPIYRTCILCKEASNRRYCDSCFSKNLTCVECKQPYTGRKWCQTCNSKRFQQNFDGWTSGNDDIDKFVQNTQLSAKNHHQILEWIPYNRFKKPKYIAEGGFGKVYKAFWKDGGYITHWDMSYHQWGRKKDDGSLVALKSLNNSQTCYIEIH
jgi:hypothetical protein